MASVPTASNGEPAPSPKPPVLELDDVFGEEDYVGPPGEVLKLQLSRDKLKVQSKSTKKRLPAVVAAAGGENQEDFSDYKHQAIVYTPVHPSNIRTPSKRGRPPKSAMSNSFGAAPITLPQSNIVPPRMFVPQQQQQQQPQIRQRNPPAVARMDNTPPVIGRNQQQQWPPATIPQTRFGGLPSFHTSLGNGIRQAQVVQSVAAQQQPPPPAHSQANIRMIPIPNILSNSTTSGGGTTAYYQPSTGRVFKPPSERAAIRATRPQQQQQQQQQQQVPLSIANIATTSTTQTYQAPQPNQRPPPFVPQAQPVRPAQDDIIRQLSSNPTFSGLIQRVLSGQPLPHNGIDANAVSEIKRQLQESFMNTLNIPIPQVNQVNPQQSMPTATNAPPPNLASAPSIQSQNFRNYRAGQSLSDVVLAKYLPPGQLPPEFQQMGIPPVIEQKKVPTEDDITKQDDDAEANQDEEYHEAETYSDYTPSKLNIGQPHPDPVVETSSLATVEPPDITYVLRLPKNVILNCLLSALQLESVTYASQQHEQFLADNKTRRGFLIGDGAGVGKGRTIAGIIYENFLAGRRKSVWLSVSPDLKLDAERDLRDIGAKQIPVHSMTKHGYGKRIEVPHGVIFLTYTGLVSKSQSVRGSLGTRLGQLINWLGPNFDGVIVFDECHKAKNISVTAKMKQSKTADSALEFQKRLPGARVVYASATGASETRHLGYMTRLGLWGEGTPYDEFKDFCSAIERRGVGAMELVAVDLKMRGSYMARQLSFKTTSFDIQIANLDDKFIALYDRCVELWSRALTRFTEACDLYNSEGKKMAKKIWMCFWAAHQKFFKYLCIGAKVPLVVEIAKQALADGKCVVIGLQSTGESKTQEALEEGDITEFISTARATFESLIENHFPAPPRSGAPSEPSPVPRLPQDLDTQGSSTDLSSTTVIDETFHSHEVVKFGAENGLASAELEEDKAARELRQSTSKVRAEFKRRTAILEELAKQKKVTPEKSRSIRAKRRAKARGTRKSRIKKPIDDSETEVSTPSDGTTNQSGDTDDTYSVSDESTIGDSATEEGDSDRTKVGDNDDDDDEGPAQPKRMKPTPSRIARMSDSDSDSDIQITAVKQGSAPRPRRYEVIILSSDEEASDEDGEDGPDPLKVHGAKLSAMRDELLKMIADIGSDLPNNTLDDLIDQLGGPDRVAEMTGRKGRVVKDEEGLISYRQRNEADALECMNIAEKERFMKGDKLVAIISEAASSGISLQADRRAGNQLRRVHITIELPWSADRAIQQFGRTHRSNQVSGPEYIFVISELSGEKRFASVVAKRLESLGALTHGDRRATTESRDLSQFNLSGRFCRQAIEQIVKYLEHFRHNDMNIRPNYDGDFLRDARQAFLDTGLAKMVYGHRFSVEPAVLHVNHFLNRLLGMKVRIQNSMFQLFTDYMDKLIARKKVTGQYDSGILELNSESGKTTCFPPEDYHLKTKAGIIKCTLHNVQVERGISWEEAKKLYEDSQDRNPDERSGFYIYAGPGTSQFISLLLREPQSVDEFRAFKPNTGRAQKPSLFSILKKGRKYTPNQAERLWKKIYDFTAQNCVHLCFFDSCKRREAKMACDVGLRHRNYCILSGGILTAWPYLETKSTDITEKVRIVRLRLDAHNRVIGPVIPQHYVDRVRQILAQGANETVVF